LIGDHKQLPPVIVSQEAKDIGLGVSLFERLTQEGSECIYLIGRDKFYEAKSL
jgi:superfamily I DNA and/or RNA helicase